jgi:hypothetical protein
MKVRTYSFIPLLPFLLIPSAALVLLSGCTSTPGSHGKATPNIHIAYAHQIKDAELADSSTLKKFQLDEIIRGEFLTNDYVYVGFAEATMPKEGLPDKAILILHLNSWTSSYEEALHFGASCGEEKFAIRSYDALRNDARQGILPDTPGNRQRIASLSLDELSRTAPRDQISKAKAIEVAKARITADPDFKVGVTCRISAHRNPYGWYLGFVLINPDGSQDIGAHGLINVGDDGLVKDVIGGR